MIGVLNKYCSRSPLLPRSKSMGTKISEITELDRVLRYPRVQKIHGLSDPDTEDFALVPRIGDDVDHNPTRRILDWRLMIEDW
jgi:hypothetical protein